MNTTPPNKHPAQPPKKAKGKLAYLTTAVVLSLLLALSSLIMCFYTVSANIAIKNKLSVSLKAQQDKNSSLQEQLSLIRQDLSSSIKDNNENIKKALQRIMDRSADQATVEAGHLIRQAAINIKYSDNLSTGLRLLELAKKRINQYTTPSLVSLKNNIQADIANLKKIPITDKGSSLQALNKLFTQVQEINIMPPPPKVQQKVKQVGSNTNDQGWWQHTKKSLEKLKSLVIIQKLDHPDQMILSPNKAMLAKEAVLLRLNEAQWALLANDNTIYHKSLQSSRIGIEHLTLSLAKKAKLLTAIRALMQNKLRTHIDIDLKSLNEIDKEV